MKLIRNILLSLLVISVFSCGSDKNQLSIKVIFEGAYECNEGGVIKVKFYSLSDESLNFIKLTMTDGKEYTLPQLVSGSGSRYCDEFQLEFLSKGEEATISKINDEGEWVVILNGKLKK